MLQTYFPRCKKREEKSYELALVDGRIQCDEEIKMGWEVLLMFKVKVARLHVWLRWLQGGFDERALTLCRHWTADIPPGEIISCWHSYNDANNISKTDVVP